MTKQRIKLSARQIQQDKARAVQRARNGAIDKCLEIFKEKINPFTSYLLNYNRAIIPYNVLEEIRREMRALKKL